jgi:hypothetical protein
MIWRAPSKKNQPSPFAGLLLPRRRSPSGDSQRQTSFRFRAHSSIRNGSSRLNLQRKSTHLSLRLVFDWSALGVFSRGSNGGIVSRMVLVLPRVLIRVVGSLRLRRSEKRAFTVSDPKKPGTRQQAAEVVSPLNRHRVLPGNLAFPNIQRAHWSEIATTKPSNSEGWRVYDLFYRTGSSDPDRTPSCASRITGDQSFPCIVSFRLSIARS